ncbi:uncharacterized protein EI97DRAFT_396640 [Westerdykella ornata]|uniref:SAGA-associated factor 11 n=1 Tax=Westerdykella ornata TaxID=318751 RepID=A0A6A6JN51_WESOR|nr:uncharacterized protein EI97DRAFT_396640 [Westerdykella ornata]KAF2277674.1 hypothetical protein EI97DRAFT_396640 [Westerdykella ornata]
MADNPKKRKQTSDGPSTAKRPRFPQRPEHHIKSTSTTSAYPNGELNVSRFMRAHENEIKALERAMVNAKKGSMRRAFQDVPRELRRRTGSHNPQRVPKRLRARAFQEAKDDNTPISKNKSGSGTGKGKQKWLRKAGREKSQQRGRKKKGKDPNAITVTVQEKPMPELAPKSESNRKVPGLEMAKPKRKKQPKLAVPGIPPSRFRRRQVNKTWLPTHIWHTKRATMTAPKEPLWRFAIPITPILKSYRLTHRAVSLRGAVAWDMSYISTIGLEGVEASLIGLLKSMHFAEEDGVRPWQETGLGKKWRNGTRAWEGWIHERQGSPPKKMSRVTVIWNTQEQPEPKKRNIFVRVHPSAFLQLWDHVTKAAKVQKPAVTVEDLRFEIGSIEIMGPAAAETACSILHPAPTGARSSGPAECVWQSLASVTDVGVLPRNPVIAFSCTDPRLRDPPRTATAASSSQSDLLTETLAYWPIDHVQAPSELFTRNARLAAGRCLPSQQSVNRRKSAAAPGQYPEARSSDPRIPMLTYISSETKTWTILLPWKCVAPVWRGIMRYPVSTGGTPRFGGLNEIHQVNFERSKPCFPFDFPGTDAGWAWELQERVKRRQDWTKRPKGKRIEWKTLDLGSGSKGELGDPWACAWELLLPKKSEEGPEPTKKLETTASSFRQALSLDVLKLLSGRHSSEEHLSLPYLFPVKISMVQGGSPISCARIYRLPTNDPELREQWLALLPEGKRSAREKRILERRQLLNRQLANNPKHQQMRDLASRLLQPEKQNHKHCKPGDNNYPCAPGDEDLMGFVTTGNYNLSEGTPTAIANIALHKALEINGTGASREGKQLCIVREAGQTLERLPCTMSEDRAADQQVKDGGDAEAASSDVLATLTADILGECLENVIFNAVVACHRSEKQLRMQSAATQAESLALSNLDPQPLKGSNAPPAVPFAETPAAKYDNGRVYLKGNPLQTTPEIVCAHCKLPRLMHPIMGKGSQTPDLTKEYCKLYPFVEEKGHDAYGNPFPDMAKSKKERELIKKSEKDGVTTPGSQDTEIPGEETQNKEYKLDTGGKPASYIPWHTCPNCKRSLLITRFAQHLEKCLGISGRQSSRQAMAKLSGQNGSGSGMGNTPLGSRMGTPAPGSQGDQGGSFRAKGKGGSPVKKLGDEEDDVDNETPEKKKKKKSSYIKKADREKMAKEGGVLKVKLKTNSLSKESSKEHEGRKMSESQSEKREREDDGDGAPKAKKLKLSLGRSESTTSLSAETRESSK